MIDLDSLRAKLNLASLHVDARLGRFYAEAEFAEGLCDIHKGSLPTSLEPLSVSPGNVVVSAVKKAEKDDGIIIRLIEMAGKRTTAKIKFDKTGFGILSSAKETDLMERPMKDGSAKLPAKDTVSVRIPGKGFATVLVKTRKKR